MRERRDHDDPEPLVGDGCVWFVVIFFASTILAIAASVAADFLGAPEEVSAAVLVCVAILTFSNFLAIASSQGRHSLRRRGLTPAVAPLYFAIWNALVAGTFFVTANLSPHVVALITAAAASLGWKVGTKYRDSFGPSGPTLVEPQAHPRWRIALIGYIGATCSFYGAKELFDCARGAFYEKTTGVITASAIRDTGWRSFFEPAIEYRYEFAGVHRSGSRYALFRHSGSKGFVESEIKQFPVHAEIDVYVNPSDPAEAVLVPTPSAASFALRAILIAIGVYFIVYASSLWRIRKREDESSGSA